MNTLFFSIVLLLAPVSIIWLTKRSLWAFRIGVVLLCYLIGLVLANVGLIPQAAIPAQQLMSEASIALALPMLLFSIDMRQWRGQFGKALMSMLLAISATSTLAFFLFFIYRDNGVVQAAHFSAMSAGVYSGGTPNLAAIKAGLNIPHPQFILFHSLDTVVTAVYLLLMLSAVSLFRGFLGDGRLTNKSLDDSKPTEQNNDPSQLTNNNTPINSSSMQSFDVSQLIDFVKPLGLSALVCIGALIIAMAAEKFTSVTNSSGVFIIALTSFSLLLSLSERIRGLSQAHEMGMYLIYVFCFTVASMASLSALAEMDKSMLFFVISIVFGSFTLHALLCRFFNIDGDTFMVTSVAAICSPPFVPIIAKALNNSQALLSGMTVGLVGYAIGNYVGIGLGTLLLNFPT